MSNDARDAMSGRFAGKSVLVAGGTGGLGRAVSLGFLDEGASVVVTYRDQKEFDVLESAVTEKSLLEGYNADLTDEAAVQQLIARILADHRGLDAVVNAVGAYAGGVPLWELESKVFDRMMALNLRSGFILARAVAPEMLKQRSGVIINIASKAAFDHAAGAAVYVASKAAAVAMMDSLAADLNGTGVRVNSVLPSIIDTEANRKAMPGADFAQWPKPENIARVILFLCSDDAKLIHGAAVPVYGNS
jgi:NAD(P)-dependent dehydrogenase (short-subunit alcohol dehydrogenase family)